MPPTSTSFTGDREGRQATIGMDYIPTEEEIVIINQCRHDAVWYRSVPFSLASMAITHGLVTRGFLSASRRFGSLPKVAFASFCGFMVGNISYMKTCQERLKMIDSPLGEYLRQKQGLPPLKSKGVQSELSDPESQSFESMFQPTEARSQRSYNTESPMQMDKSDDFSAPVESHLDEEEPRRKAILYEDLRLKNRENYEVTLTQKAETLLKPSPERESKRPPKAKNIYGDTWEE